MWQLLYVNLLGFFLCAIVVDQPLSHLDHAVDILPMGNSITVARSSGIVWNVDSVAIPPNHGVWFCASSSFKVSLRDAMSKGIQFWSVLGWLKA